jgi:hypothetical protein
MEANELREAIVRGASGDPGALWALPYSIVYLGDMVIKGCSIIANALLRKEGILLREEAKDKP